MVFLKAIRIHQWAKNFIVFLPMLMAHQVSDAEVLTRTIIAFFAFSLSASSVYLLNDILDRESDRQHPTKKNRPIAAGKVSVLQASILLVIFLIGGFLLATILPSTFIIVLALYWMLTLIYSLFLKRIEIVDILTLASLYTLRLLAGGYAAEVLVSDWLLAFSMFFFLSLSCLKRFSELLELKKSDQLVSPGRGYQVGDLHSVGVFGAASGYISVLVLALYMKGAIVTNLYSHPWLLWFLCPVVLYWVSYMWLKAHRGEMHEDPVAFSLRDWKSYIAGAICAGVVFFAV